MSHLNMQRRKELHARTPHRLCRERRADPRVCILQSVLNARFAPADWVFPRALDEADVSRVVLHEQENAGAHAAIMRGLSLASGPCLTVLNSDDYYLPGRLERVHALAEEREHYLIFTGVSFVDDGSQPLADDNAYLSWYQKMLVESTESPTLGFALLRNNLSVTSGNLVFSRDLYDAVGGFRDLDFCHDWDFVMRAVRWVEPDFIEERNRA